MRIRASVTAAVSLAMLAASGVAQDPSNDPNGDAKQSASARTIEQWVFDYEHDRLAPSGLLRKEPGLWPRYCATARAGNLLTERDPGNLTHLEALQKILLFAEQHPDGSIGEAILGLASVGIDKSLADNAAIELRDLGHVTLLNIDQRGIWFAILRTAGGLLLKGEDGVVPTAPTTARRVAALRLLGFKDEPVFRIAIEAGLLDLDPRVRLVAVEGLQSRGRHRKDSLPLLVRCCGTERHPVVAAAILRAMQAVLEIHREYLSREEVDTAVGVALQQLGKSGWRADMDLLSLIEAFPQKAAIPSLIDLLRSRSSADDSLVTAINKDASPLLRDRAFNCLRGMTGAIYTIDQHKQWREFWLQEQGRIVVPDRVQLNHDLGGTRSAFFGIPVIGRQIVFVIDLSGSMDSPHGASLTAQSQNQGQVSTRLSIAKDQLLLAVQSMDNASRYQLLTFDSEAHFCSKQPVAPSSASLRSLTELLARLKSGSGTNIYDGLSQALALPEARYGATPAALVDEVFLLSDGEPNCGALQNPDEILRVVRTANAYLKVRINTVFIGTDRGSKFLQQLASENGGVFVQR